MSLPLPRRLESIAQYYRALDVNRAFRGDTDRAGPLFEYVADNASSAYKARALLALGGNYLERGDYHSAMAFYREVARILTLDCIFDPATHYFAAQMTAVVKGLEGDHQAALADFDKLLPLVRIASRIHPHIYYDYLNSRAVELGEIGRLGEARYASKIALSSPLANVYPNWRETFRENLAKEQRASRSVVAVRQDMNALEKLASLPERETDADHALSERFPQAIRARVLSLQQWKSMARQTRRPLVDKLTPEQRKRLSTGEKLIRLMDLLSQDDIDDETIDRILEAAEQIVANRRNRKLD